MAQWTMDALNALPVVGGTTSRVVSVRDGVPTIEYCVGRQVVFPYIEGSSDPIAYTDNDGRAWMVGRHNGVLVRQAFLT